MEIMERKVIMDRIKEVEQEQLIRLYYICRYLANNVDINKQSTRERMLQLREEKQKLFE